MIRSSPTTTGRKRWAATTASGTCAQHTHPATPGRREATQAGQIGDTALVCLHCIVDEHPELANALDHARRHGEWIADI
jgi:hypothetical protein